MTPSPGPTPVRVRSGSPASSPPLRRPSPAEAGLLELARELGATPTPVGDRAALPRALALLDAAFGPGAPLPRQLAQAWLRTRGDKTAALALGWAREQVRRALADIVRGVRGRGDRDAEVPADAAAWLLLAAAEGESHEVDGNLSDRLSLVCALLALR